MFKLSLTLLLLTFFLFSTTQAPIAKVQTVYAFPLSSGTVVYSPVNRTYNTKFLTLNFTFGAGLGIKCSVSYCIDGNVNISIPLVEKYPDELHVVNPMIGLTKLPELDEGSHNITIHVLCGLYDYHGARPPGEPFKPTFPGSADYEARWADTIYFTINTNSQENTIPEFPAWIILPLTLSATLIAAAMKRQKL